MAKSQSKQSKSNGFISEDSISEGSASYMKLVTGENKVRIISKPITGWLHWVDKKPYRTTIEDGEPETTDPKNKPKKFLAVVVIDLDDDQVKIMEITQQSVIKAIKALADNPEWGNPFGYDLNIKKSGADLKTKYVVTPSPKKPLSKDLIKAAQAKPCNLEALMEGEDPWNTDESDTTEYFFK